MLHVWPTLPTPPHTALLAQVHVAFSSVLCPFQEHPVYAQQELLLFCFPHVTCWKTSASSVPRPRPRGSWRLASLLQAGLALSNNLGSTVAGLRDPICHEAPENFQQCRALASHREWHPDFCLFLTPSRVRSRESQEELRTWAGSVGEGYFLQRSLSPSARYTLCH